MSLQNELKLIDFNYVRTLSFQINDKILKSKTLVYFRMVNHTPRWGVKITSSGYNRAILEY